MDRDDAIDLKRLYYILRRRIVLILLFPLSFTGLAFAYLSITPDMYAARAVILLDQGVSKTISGVSSLNLANYESGAIDSEVQILKSKRVTDAVVRLLRPRGYFHDVPPETDRGDFILFERIQNGLRVNRVEKTYALSISYRSTDPREAADVANAFADAYIADQLNALADTSRRTLGWLQTKAGEMKDKAQDARERLARYRVEFNAETQKSIGKKDQAAVAQDTRLRTFRDLEQEVETYDTIYESYLEKIRTLSLEQSFPVTETQILTYATAPLKKSGPHAPIILGMAVILGLGLGAMIALTLDFFDKTLKRGGQVRRELDLAFLGFLPGVRSMGKRQVTLSAPDKAGWTTALYTQAVDKEQSLCAETVRALKNVIDMRQVPESGKDKDKSKGRIIGVLSIGPGEDVFAVASNLATHCARDDSRVMLIRGDTHRGASDSGRRGKRGDFCSAEAVQDVLVSQTYHSVSLDVHMLRSGTQGDGVSCRFNAQGMAALLGVCAQQYDYTVIDLPPLSAVSDLYTYLPCVDDIVVVAQWGKTESNALNFHLQQARVDRDKIAGLVLSRTSAGKMRRHYGHVVYRKFGA